jgi:hypothetical protein
MPKKPAIGEPPSISYNSPRRLERTAGRINDTVLRLFCDRALQPPSTSFAPVLIGQKRTRVYRNCACISRQSASFLAG